MSKENNTEKVIKNLWKNDDFKIDMVKLVYSVAKTEDSFRILNDIAIKIAIFETKKKYKMPKSKSSMLKMKKFVDDVFGIMNIHDQVYSNAVKLLYSSAFDHFDRNGYIDETEILKDILLNHDTPKADRFDEIENYDNEELKYFGISILNYSNFMDIKELDYIKSFTEKYSNENKDIDFASLIQNRATEYIIDGGSVNSNVIKESRQEFIDSDINLFDNSLKGKMFDAQIANAYLSRRSSEVVATNNNFIDIFRSQIRYGNLAHIYNSNNFKYRELLRNDKESVLNLLDLSVEDLRKVIPGTSVIRSI